MYLELFSDLKLIEEKYIYGKEVYDKYDKEKGFGTGLFHFKKLLELKRNIKCDKNCNIKGEYYI